MSVGLEALLAAQARFFAAASAPADATRALLVELPGWSAPADRVALYADFAYSHVAVLLEQLYRATRAALPAPTWTELVRRYYALRPTRIAYEVNAAGAGFPALLASLCAELDLPRFAPALARFEWTIYQVYSRAIEVPERVERLTLNPTVEALEHAWRLCAFVAEPLPLGAPAPSDADEVALLWRHPVTQLVRFMPASARTLLAVKVAVEGLDPADVARAGGASVDDVQGVLDEHVHLGLLLTAA